ncbi:hypothetical protein Hanom_Chr05g00417411 [Helianthus anomalus]
MLFREPNVLVAAGISDKWPARSKEVPVLLFNGEVAELYQSAFPTFGRAMGVRPLGDGEVFWYEEIKPNFMYAPAEVFATPPTTTEGARIPKQGLYEGATKTKVAAKKKVTVDVGGTSKKTGGGLATAEIPKKRGLLDIGEKPQSSAAVASKNARSAGSRGPNSGSTPSSVYEEEEEAEEEVEAEKLVTRKRSRYRSCSYT